MNAVSALSILVVGIIIVAGVFSVTREIVLWYFRINESIQIAKESRDYLKELVRLASPEDEEDEQAPVSAAEAQQRRLPAHFRR